MENLSASVVKDIKNKPTRTILRNETFTAEKEYINTPKYIPNIDITLPKEFDGRKVWKDFLTPSINQGECGSCWAFASTSCLADRFNISSRGKMHIKLSPVLMLLCYIGDNQDLNLYTLENKEDLYNTALKGIKNWSCFGNTLMMAWKYLNIIGASTLECMPYKKIFTDFKGIETVPLCFSVAGKDIDLCSDFDYDKQTGNEYGKPIRFFRCKNYWAVPGTKETGGNEEYIRYTIYKWGPVTAGFRIYPDFYTFNPKTTIYQWNGEGKKISGHAVEIVGWGEEKEVKYWIIKNFWGPQWGINGYFKMIRGINNCYLEDNIIEGSPDFFYPPGFSLALSEDIEISVKLGEEARNKIDTDVSLTGGGIDPSTGYSRRVLSNRPWLNKNRPVELDDLPDWETWYAGKTISLKKPSNNYVLIFTIISIIVIIIFFFLFNKYALSNSRK